MKNSSLWQIPLCVVKICLIHLLSTELDCISQLPLQLLWPCDWFWPTQCEQRGYLPPKSCSSKTSRRISTVSLFLAAAGCFFSPSVITWIHIMKGGNSIFLKINQANKHVFFLSNKQSCVRASLCILEWWSEQTSTFTIQNLRRCAAELPRQAARLALNKVVFLIWCHLYLDTLHVYLLVKTRKPKEQGRWNSTRK